MRLQDAFMIDALVGLLVGVPVWLLGRRLAGRSKGATAGLVALIAGLVALGHGIIVPGIHQGRLWRAIYEGERLSSDEKTAAALADLMAPVFASPAFQRRLAALEKQPSKVHHVGGRMMLSDDRYAALTEELVTAGMARLPRDEVNALFETRQRLAEISEPLCAMWLTDQANVDRDAAAAGVRTLKESDQKLWMTVSARAVKLELEATAPPVRIPVAAVETAMAAVLGALPPDQQKAVMDAYENRSLPPEEACRAFRGLAAGMKNLTPDVRATLIRAFEHGELVDP